ncbi:MAG: FliG C-terminal domain-containing protein [Pseudomonadota bacterium]
MAVAQKLELISDTDTSPRLGNTSNTPSASPITEAEQAVVILSLLGEASAQAIMERLDNHAVERVQARLESISKLDQNTLAEIVRQFLIKLNQFPSEFRNGHKNLSQIVPAISDARRQAEAVALDENADPALQAEVLGGVWERLAAQPAEKLADYLNTISPNLIAFVLRRVPNTFSSDVLARLDNQKLIPVMEYLIQPDDASPQIVSVVERTLELEFLNVLADDASGDTAHLAEVGEVLSLLPNERRESVVEFLRGQHEEKYDKIEKSIFTIETLPDTIPRKVVAPSLRELDTKAVVRLIASIQASHNDTAEFLLGNISSRVAEGIRDELKDLDPLSPEEQEAEIRNYLSILMNLKRQGQLEIE